MARNYVFSTAVIHYRACDKASRVARILYMSKLAQDRPRRRARMIRDVCVCVCAAGSYRDQQLSLVGSRRAVV
jgi:hypothetical protein